MIQIKTIINLIEKKKKGNKKVSYYFKATIKKLLQKIIK